MDKLLKNATDCFDYLINDCHLLVSLHFAPEAFDDINEKVVERLLPYMIHRNPYCRYMCDYVSYDRCLVNQRGNIHSFKTDEPRVCQCYAGVREIIYPIRRGGITVGDIAVSGYRADEALEREYNEPLRQRSLIDADIPRRITDALIPPLVTVVEKLLTYPPRSGDSEFNKILNYLAEHHRDVTLDGLATYLNRSRSHVSHVFKKQCGSTLRAYCNSLKLSDAARMLSDTDMSVTEVALASGFDDVSYFIRLFREKYGTSPHKHRTAKGK